MAPKGTKIRTCKEGFIVQKSLDYSTKCRWRIKKNKLPVYSRYFPVDKLNCRLLIGGDDGGFLSVNLQTNRFEGIAYCQITMNNHEKSKSIIRYIFGRFIESNRTYGWDEFYKYSIVKDAESGFLFDDSLDIEIDIRVLKEQKIENSMDSRAGQFSWTLLNFRFFLEILGSQKIYSPVFKFSCCNVQIAVNRVGEDVCFYIESEDTCCFEMSICNKIHTVSQNRFPLDDDSKCIDIKMPLEQFVDDDTVISVCFQAIKEIYMYPEIPNPSTSVNQTGIIWRIFDFTKFNNVIVNFAVKSKMFRVGDQKFRLVVYPRGKFQTGCLSFFVEAVEVPDLNSSDIYSYRLFVLEFGKSTKDSFKRSSWGHFSAGVEMGWSEFMNIDWLTDANSRFCVSDSVAFCAVVSSLNSELCDALVDREGQDLQKVQELEFKCSELITERESLIKQLIDVHKIEERNNALTRELQELQKHDRSLEDVARRQSGQDLQKVQELEFKCAELFTETESSQNKPKDSSSNNHSGNHKKNPMVHNVATPNKTLKLQDYAAVTCSPELEFEFDPAIMAEIDREVEEFARRLESAWANKRGGLH